MNKFSQCLLFLLKLVSPDRGYIWILNGMTQCHQEKVTKDNVSIYPETYKTVVETITMGSNTIA